ncbi:MAG: glycosyltransferase family 4 protein [Bacteroidota bacterium]
MRVIILSQYFPPEIGAPQNRLYELAVRLKDKGIDIQILTAMPNYPKMEIMNDYKGRYCCIENMNNLEVHRSYIFVSKSKSIFFRLINYFSFVFSSLLIGAIKLKKADVLICESPPLFLGISGWILAKIKGAKFIFNVSDLWPESAEKLGLVTNKFFLKMATVLEEFCYRKSTIITGQTQGICNEIKSRFPNKRVYWLPNGVDEKFFDTEHSNVLLNWRKENNFSENDFLLLYAGIIGFAQGLEVILYTAELVREHTNIKFIILGSGPEKEKLLQLKQDLNLSNVFFYDSQPKSQMPSIVNAVDVAVIPLKKLDLFLGAIPSKIFENLAMKKPILLGVDGEARQLFINDGQAGLYFEPENFSDLANKTMLLYNNREKVETLGSNGYNYVLKNFSRNKIAAEFLIELKEINKNSEQAT